MAPTWKTTRYSDVKTIQHTRHLHSYDVRFQDGGIGDLSELGGTVFFRLFRLSFDVCTCIKVVFHEVHTEDYRCIKVQRPVRQWGTFYVAYEACQCAWTIALCTTCRTVQRCQSLSVGCYAKYISPAASG